MALVEPVIDLPIPADIAAAARRIRGRIHETPVITSRTADAALGARVFFKCENFQRAGAFKSRGAMNALSRLSPAQRAQGVVAFSSGNHAQAVALAARELALPATIVMPHDAPRAKMAATRGYGAEIVEYDRYTEDREAIAADIAGHRGATLIPPYDHPDIIAGQGTAAHELFAEAGPLDALFVCLGGGGLLAGSALAARSAAPDCRVYGVEPAAGNDGQQSLRAGHIVTIDTPETIADGAQTRHLGRYTFPVIQSHVADIDTVDDHALIHALRFFAERLKLIIEPTGGLAWAGALQRAPALAGQRVGVIVSGGNVDLDRYAALLGQVDQG